MENDSAFELCVSRTLALCVFRLAPEGVRNEDLNSLNKALASRLNEREEVFYTPTMIPENISVRFILHSRIARRPS